MKIKTILASLLVVTSVWAGPVLQMNKAFIALSDLIPFITSRDQFMEKKNEPVIGEKINELQKAFKTARHDTLIKEDLFAPSYALINENIADSLDAFKKGNKDYAHWRLKEITTHCLDCHTRLPPAYSSSFQNGELMIDTKKFQDFYNLGIAQLIVRRYEDAKTSFVRSIDDKIIKKEFTGIEAPMKQLLLIDTKVLKNPKNAASVFETYKQKKELPEDVKKSLAAWLERLEHWKNKPLLKKGLHTESEVDTFITSELQPLKSKPLTDGNDVDLLITSGLLSNYLFTNPTSNKAPEISYWLGWAEKYLKRENFFGSGDLFLKQCIKRYPSKPIARKCLDEYRESVEFDFSGSAGTNVPEEVQKKLKSLERLIKLK